MRFKELIVILKSMQRPPATDIWDDERTKGLREGYNRALEDVAKTIQIELKKETAASEKSGHGFRQDTESDTSDPPD